MRVYGMECVADENGYIQRAYCCGGWCNIYKACVKRYFNGERMAQQLRRWINNNTVKFM